MERTRVHAKAACGREAVSCIACQEHPACLQVCPPSSNLVQNADGKEGE